MHGRYSLFPILLTYFLDTFGLAMVFPIFTPLILSTQNGFLSPATSDFQRTVLLGILIAVFPFAQFFGAPFLGELSDQVGRKKTLLISIGGAFLGYVLSGVGIHLTDFSLLIIGRTWTGLFAGNLTICFASIADISHNEQQRAKNFGLIGAMGGLSFLAAMMISGILNMFNPAFPFWMTAFLAILNLLSVYLLFHESHPIKKQEKLHLFRGFRDVATAFKVEQLRKVYLVYFFFMTAWSSTMQFLPTMLIEHYQASEWTQTLVLIMIGFLWSAMNLFLNRILATHYTPLQTLKVSLFFLSGLLVATLSAENLSFFLLLFFFTSCFGALAWTNANTAASISAPEKVQGAILGINQSIGSLATICGPTLGGILAGINPHLVFLFSGLASLAAALFLYQTNGKHFKSN